MSTSNRLKLVNSTLNTMSQAGYDLNGKDIAFVWKVAAGDASGAEIMQWTQTVAARLPHTPSDPEVLRAMQAIFDDIRSNTAHVRRCLATVTSPHPIT